MDSEFANEQYKKLLCQIDRTFSDFNINSLEVKGAIIGQELSLFSVDTNPRDLLLVEDVNVAASSTKLPTLHQIEKSLNKTAAILNEKAALSEFECYEILLYFAKVTTGLHSRLTISLMNSSVEFPNSLSFLSEAQTSYVKLSLHFLQTLPRRLKYLWHKANSHKSYNGILSLLNFKKNEIYRRSSFSLFSPKLKSKNIFNTSFIKQVRQHNVFFTTLELLKSETKFNSSVLYFTKLFEAISLGILKQNGIGFTHEKGSKAEIGECGRNISNSLNLMNHILERREELTEFVLKKDSAFTVKEVDGELEAMTDIISLNENKNYLNLKEIQNFSHLLKKLTKKLKNYDKTTHVIHYTFGKPDALELYWPHITVGVLLTWFGVREFKIYRNSLKELAVELIKTTKTFVSDWVIEPLIKIYETIRHKEDRLALLERMVIDFSKSNGIVSDAELNVISEKVVKGDLTPILKAYEREIKNPLINVVKGNLVQALLIQVQKLKVDGEIAMSALDKLLKSNELNFAFLAALPIFSLTGYMCKKAINFFSAKRFLTKDIISKRIKSSLREVEKILSKTKKGKQINFKEEGLLLSQMYLLRKYLKEVPVTDQFSFLEDLRDLESNDLSLKQKLRVLDRIWKHYDFLK
ncbi:Nuclear control of ATPase protein 2 [Lobulomyces angularis]|nr:Nuclear control of ATPase protein 2 [Lobulomyces angularis]